MSPLILRNYLPVETVTGTVALRVVTAHVSAPLGVVFNDGPDGASSLMELRAITFARY